MRTEYEGVIRRYLQVEDYQFTNETINRLLEPGDVVKTVQGPYGRCPVFAKTEEEAIQRYIDKFFHRIEKEEVDDEEE